MFVIKNCNKAFTKSEKKKKEIKYPAFASSFSVEVGYFGFENQETYEILTK